MFLSGNHKDTTGRWIKAILLKMLACVSSIVFLQEKKRWQRMLWPISYNGSHFPLQFPLQKQTIQSTIRNKNKWSAITAKRSGRDNPPDNGDTTRGLDMRLDAGSGGWHRLFFIIMHDCIWHSSSDLQHWSSQCHLLVHRRKCYKDHLFSIKIRE